MKTIFLIITFMTTIAFAGMQWFDSSGAEVGSFAKGKCSTGLTCTASGGKLNIVASQTTGTTLDLSSTLSVTGTSTLTGGVVASSGQFKNYNGWASPTLTSGTSTTPSTTTVYLSQIFVAANATLTGIKINNGATVGTDKYIVALFNSAGTPVANSALAGTTTSGANVYQTIPFTATYAAVGPAVYWIALYVNGTTDRFFSVPAVGEHAGLAGSVTGQTFGTVAAVTLPTTFTADKGPVAFTY